MEATTSTSQAEDTRDALIESGFLPTDSGEDFEPAWIAKYGRHDAWRPADGGTFGDLWLVTFDDEQIHLSLTTHSGVIRTEARFSTNPFGLDLFVKAMA